MNDTLARLSPIPAPGADNTLEHLTFAYAEAVERHGPLLGMGDVKSPADAVEFAASQAALAKAQDAESDSGRRLNLMLERNAREHTQIGRLASFVAGYELAHGDPGNAPSMMELGGSHFDLAADCRRTLAENGGLTANQNAIPNHGLDDLAPPDIRAEIRAEIRDEIKADIFSDRTPPERGY